MPEWAAPTYSIVLIRWWYSSIELKWYRWQLGFQNHYMVHRQLRLCRPLSSSHRPASISVANNSSYRCIVCSHPLCRASPISFASYSGNCSTSFFSFGSCSGSCVLPSLSSCAYFPFQTTPATRVLFALYFSLERRCKWQSVRVPERQSKCQSAGATE